MKTIEEKIKEIPNSAALIAAQKKAGSFTSLSDFYDQHRSLTNLDDEPNTLAKAKAIIADLKTSIDRRAREIGAAAFEPQRLQLLERAEKAEASLAEAQQKIIEIEAADTVSEMGQKIIALTAEREKATAENQRLTSLLDLAEGAMQVRGTSTKDLVPSIAAPGAKKTPEEFETRLRNAQSLDERESIMAEFDRAVENGTLSFNHVPRGTAGAQLVQP